MPRMRDGDAQVVESVPVPDELNADDFVLGLFAALAARGEGTISMREPSFYSAVRASYERLEQLADNEPGTAELSFWVNLDPLYGDSAVVRNALNATVQRTFLSFDNPEFVTVRSKLSAAEARDALTRLPGRPEWYTSLASTFLEVRDAIPA